MTIIVAVVVVGAFKSEYEINPRPFILFRLQGEKAQP